MDNVIVIDVGNTSTGMALAEGRRITHVTHLEGGANPTREIWKVLRGWAAEKEIAGCVLASVVPATNRSWISAIKRILGFKPLLVAHNMELGVTISYPRPETIGADRLANSSAAASRHGVPVIVADFGTALTFDVVSPEGAYVGGVIAPGLPLMTDYLAEKTALLPHIRLRGACSEIGKSTVSAMRIGARVGYRGIVREIVRHIEKEMRFQGVNLCATGGYAKWALRGLDMPFVFDPNLTFHGLRRIYDLNPAKGRG